MYLHLTIFLTEGKRAFSVSVLFLACSGNGYVSGSIYYRQISTWRLHNMVYVTVVVFVCSYVHTTLELFISQFSSAQIPTASAASLTYLVKLVTLLPLIKWDTSSVQLIYINGEPDLFDWLLIKLEGDYSNKGCEKIYRTEEAYETYLPKNDI